jgi:hypothetical protein
LATPQLKNPPFPKALPQGRFNPSKVYRRRPHNYLIVKTLFQGNLPLAPMDHYWNGKIYKLLNLPTNAGYPNTMPKESHKWFSKCTRNNIITLEDHLEAIGVAMKDNGI